MSEFDISELISGIGMGALNMLPGLVTGVPELMQAQLAAQAKAGKVSPVAVQMFSPLINEGYGALLDWVTGSGDSAIRASDLLGSPTLRDLHRAELSRKLKSQFRQLNTVTSSEDIYSGVMQSIYGNAWKDESGTFGSKILRSIIEENQDTIARIASASTTRLVTDKVLSEGEQAREFYTNISKELQNAILGDGTQGTRRVTGPLSSQDVAAAAAEFFQTHRSRVAEGDANIPAELRTYLAKIADGVANMKDTLGRNTNMQQARAFTASIYGFDVSQVSGDLFSQLTNTLKHSMLNFGVTQQQLLGDPATRTPGLLAATYQMLQPLGVTREAIGNVAIATGALTHEYRNLAFGETTKEREQLLSNLAATIEVTGQLEEAGAVYWEWAAANNRDRYSRESLNEFVAALNQKSLEDLKSEYNGYTEHIGTAALRELRAAIDPDILYTISTQYIKDKRKEILTQVQAGAELPVNPLDYTSFEEFRNAYYAEAKAANIGNALTEKQLNLLYTDSAKRAASAGIPMGRAHAADRVEYGKTAYYASGDLVTSVTQYLVDKRNSGEDATLAEAVSVALFGRAGVVTSESAALKLLNTDADQVFQQFTDKQSSQDKLAYAYYLYRSRGGGKGYDKFREDFQDATKVGIEVASNKELDAYIKRVNSGLPSNWHNMTNEQRQAAIDSYTGAVQDYRKQQAAARLRAVQLNSETTLYDTLEKDGLTSADLEWMSTVGQKQLFEYYRAKKKKGAEDREFTDEQIQDRIDRLTEDLKILMEPADEENAQLTSINKELTIGRQSVGELVAIAQDIRDRISTVWPLSAMFPG